MSRRRTTGLAAAVLVLVLGACGGDPAPRDPAPDAATTPSSSPGPTDAGPTDAGPTDAVPTDAVPTDAAPAEDAHSGHHDAPAAEAGTSVPLRRGERGATLTMATSYEPSSPTGVGTDDYRCFLLDPRLAEDRWLTGTHVLPGNSDVVHHVILFRVPPEDVAEAQALDARDEEQGWTCFGGSGLAGDAAAIDDASWLGAWAPGGEESVTQAGYGTALPAGSRVVMQVHYNLLAGAEPDRSGVRLRLRDGAADLVPLHTYLTPAPVELPCRPGRDDSPLCDRDAAIADARSRIGASGGVLADVLHLLCGTEPASGDTTTCTRTVGRGMTVHAVAGHMHLLGRRITIETNPGTPRARTVLDVRPWNFDDQGSRPVEPVRLDPFDTVRITCRHVQWLRDVMPAFETQREDRYVVWGEGTTDEMCLGMLSVSFDDES